jgi:hypothetical protein
MGAGEVDPIVRFADPVMVIAHWHNAQIIDLGGKVTLEHVRALKMSHNAVVTRFPNLITAITMVRPTVPMSEKAVHDELAKLMKEQQQSGIAMKGACVVYESKGVLGSAIRAVARTLMTITGNRQSQIVGSVAEGVTMMLPYLRTVEGETVARSALEQAINKARATYDKQIAAEPAQRLL